MHSLFSEIGHRFWEHPDLVVKTQKTGEASLLHAPIGRQLFHSRRYGALFDLDQADDYMNSEKTGAITNNTADDVLTSAQRMSPE